MTAVEVLKNKIHEVEKYLEIVKKYQQYSNEEILQDVTIHGAVERYLYLLCQSAIDFAEAAVSHLNLRPPATYAEIFEILRENELISSKISLEMEKMTGFRNILAHAYGKVEFDIVYKVLTKDINNIETFLSVMKEKLKF